MDTLGEAFRMIFPVLHESAVIGERREQPNRQVLPYCSSRQIGARGIRPPLIAEWERPLIFQEEPSPVWPTTPSQTD